jgi:transposase-like protein
MHHCSTAQQRSEWISQLLVPEPAHGLVSQLSRTHQISRQTLYRWKVKGAHALQAALETSPVPAKCTMQVQEQVLTLLIEAHASYRDIQACLMKLCGIRISLGSIAGIVQEAGRRAQRWLSQQRAGTPRAWALDEQYSSQRGKAYLNVIDVHSGQVWASLPPVAVDGESWTLVWWYLHEQGLLCERSVSDGGRAIQDALGQVQRLDHHQRDVWHVLHTASQVQGRCDRGLQQLQDRLPIIQRQAERLAQGKKARGRAPAANVAEHEHRIERAKYVSQALRYLLQELHTLLDIVVLGAQQQAGVLSSRDRQQELEALLALLEELPAQALPTLQKEIRSLGKQLRLALPHLLLFAADLDTPQQQAYERLGPRAIHLIAWAWQRRALLGPTTKDLLDGFDPAWREAAQALLHAWERTVRASSAVENWHSIVRPHLAVHRTLSAGMLALLAVWHNHHVAPRGFHEGLSPLQRTGTLQPETDWLVALGYSCQAT